nr:hypothetical protein [candidate division Zixibacteria bacterium]
MADKPKDFQLEIRLGLALIILVLVILNFASHYTLFRVRNSIRFQVEDELLEASVILADNVQRFGYGRIPDLVVGAIQKSYNLDRISFVQLDFNRAMAIYGEDSLDSDLRAMDSTLTTRILRPVLENRPVYNHHRGDIVNTVIYPMEYAGSDYLISVTKSNNLLSSLENAGRILLYVGLLGIVIILYATIKFLRMVIYPYKRLREKAEKSGRLISSDRDDMSQLILSYENIIADLKDKEKELVRLNDLTSRRAEDLEVYNNYILKSIDTGIITLDTNHLVSTVNQAAIAILDLNGWDGNSVDYSVFFHDQPELIPPVEKFYETRDNVYRQTVVLKKKEGERILNISLTRMIDSKGYPIGSAIILNDQTEFVKLQEELDLKRHLATLGEMSAGLAHQLRNSITALVGFSRLINKKAVKDDSLRQNTEHLLREAIEAESLVARFLEYARPLEIECDRLNVLDMVKIIIATAMEKYPNVRFEILPQDKILSEITGDFLLLKQAVGNIVDNACQSFKDKAGRVSFEFSESGHSLALHIVDNGPGIPEDYRDKIFAPFFSGNPSGSGLGLPLARKIISLHQGSIDFDTEIGKGTEFCIFLPRSMPQNTFLPAIAETASKV